MKFKVGDIVMIDASDSSLHIPWCISTTYKQIHLQLAEVISVSTTYGFDRRPCIRVALLTRPISTWALPESMLSIYNLPIQQKVIIEAMQYELKTK